MYRATTKGLIEGLISGYNATVFAYGPTGVYPLTHTPSHTLVQTHSTYEKHEREHRRKPTVLLNPPPAGCGKTYTMLGTDKEPGIYVRTLNDLFRAIEETSDDMLYSVSMSYLEVSQRERGQKERSSSFYCGRAACTDSPC